MLYETHIGKLSKQRLNNLLKGKNVRIKNGTAHTIYLTEQQLKKFHRNTKQGKAFTVKLNQDQIAKQGSGIVADLVGLVHPTVGKLASIAGLGMKKSGDGIVADLVGLVHPTAGKLASIAGLGMKKSGDGFLADLAKTTAINLAKSAGKAIVDKGTDMAREKTSEYLKSKIDGMGRVKRRATSAQLEALARGRAKRDANRQSRGGALFASGY